MGFAKALKLIGLHQTNWDKQYEFGTELASAATLKNLKSSLNPGDETWDYEKWFMATPVRFVTPV